MISKVGYLKMIPNLSFNLIQEYKLLRILVYINLRVQLPLLPKNNLFINNYQQRDKNQFIMRILSN